MQRVQEEMEKLEMMMMMMKMFLGSRKSSENRGVTWPLVARDSADGVTTARTAARKPWSIFSAISWTRAMKYLESTQTDGERGTTYWTW